MGHDAVMLALNRMVHVGVACAAGVLMLQGRFGQTLGRELITTKPDWLGAYALHRGLLIMLMLRWIIVGTRLAIFILSVGLTRFRLLGEAVLLGDRLEGVLDRLWDACDHELLHDNSKVLSRCRVVRALEHGVKEMMAAQVW